MSEAYEVRAFTEFFSDHDRMEAVKANLLARLRAAGHDPADAEFCVTTQGFRGAFVGFVCVATVIAEKPT